MPKAINNQVKFQSKDNHIKYPSKIAVPKVQKKNDDEIDLKAHTIEQLYQIAEQSYKKQKGSESNKLNSIISESGTRKDKINLMATSILKNPESSLQQFDQLIKWCFDHNHNFAIDSSKVLANVYIEHILNEKPTLQIFMESVQSQIKSSKKHSLVSKAELVGFYLEHHLKHFYGELIKSMEILLTSNILFAKKTAISLLASLTKFKELRRLIISLLMNKFGDQDMEIVNEVSKCLKNQFYQDLQSSETLLEEAESFLFRSNLSDKAQFYVINFLNNINIKFLTDKGLTKLFELFYHFFEKLMEKESEEGSISSRLFLNSIKGLNKIFVFIKGGNKQTKEIIEKKIDSVYRVVHESQNTKAKIQLFLFLFQGHSHLHSNLPDRYYRALYDFIGRDEILKCSLTEIFFDLTLISMKEDCNINRCIAFLKRLLQLCFAAQTNFIATCLILIGKVLEEKQAIKIFLKQKQNALDEGDGQSKMYDMWKREPIYAGAENTCLWQLTILKRHYHPTVRKFATHLLNNEKIPYEGNNPLIELNQTSFLEKLSLRKEKKSDSWKIKVHRHLKSIRSTKYETLIDKPLDSFKEDQEFIKKYLSQRAVIHTNMKKIQSKDIQQFADQVIEREMDRLNPKDHGFDDLSMSEEPGLSGSQNDEGEEGFDQQEGQQFEDQEFGSDVDGSGNQENYDEEGFSNSEENIEDSDLPDKQFQEAFEEVGDDQDDYPRKNKKIGKFSKKSKPSFKNNKSKGKKSFGKKR